MTIDEPAALRAEIQRLTAALASHDQRPPPLLPPAAVEVLLRGIPGILVIWELRDPADSASLHLHFVNQSFPTASGADSLAFVGRPILEFVPYIPRSELDVMVGVLHGGTPVLRPEVTLRLPDGTENVSRNTLIPLSPQLLAVVTEDITDRMRAERAHRQMQEQEAIIRAQQTALLELSTPLIPITDTVVAMPLIGALDSRRAQQVLMTLLDGIAETRATVAILDITGVPIVDTQVANTLIQAAQAVKLLGAQVVLTGIRPEVAQTLIGLGVRLDDIITMSNLQAGIGYATQR